jgi:NAD(P)H-nitrite reductase large subunit
MTLAQELAADLSDDQALEKISQVVAYYKESAQKGERLGMMIDRIGFETVRAALL